MAIVLVERLACALSIMTKSGDQISSSACRSVGKENTNTSMGIRSVTFLIVSIFFGFTDEAAAATLWQRAFAARPWIANSRRFPSGSILDGKVGSAFDREVRQRE